MKVRKKNNLFKRRLSATIALLRKSNVVVVDISPSDTQGLMNWQRCQPIHTTRQLVDGVCDLPHNWTVFIAAFCQSQLGERYMKADEIVPQGCYRSEQINDSITLHHEALIATCNPAHVIGYGWIASPVGQSLDENQAARVFESLGCWDQQAVA
jgi:hypothetical protein